ncbi:Uncharacterised protein [Acinetobacter baumannii]|nr:Uncharacterised protein [Acinetobacter baumannii]
MVVPVLLYAFKTAFLNVLSIFTEVPFTKLDKAYPANLNSSATAFPKAAISSQFVTTRPKSKTAASPIIRIGNEAALAPAPAK